MEGGKSVPGHAAASDLGPLSPSLLRWCSTLQLLRSHQQAFYGNCNWDLGMWTTNALPVSMYRQVKTSLRFSSVRIALNLLNFVCLFVLALTAKIITSISELGDNVISY